MTLDQIGVHKAELEAAARLAPDVRTENLLFFSLARQIIWGKLGETAFGPVKAVSGAGQDGVTEKDVKYSRWNPSLAKTSANRGGCDYTWLVDCGA